LLATSSAEGSTLFPEKKTTRNTNIANKHIQCTS
jgi:hypothetical protein